jgi:hypothetical protein
MRKCSLYRLVAADRLPYLFPRMLQNVWKENMPRNCRANPLITSQLRPQGNSRL